MLVTDVFRILDKKQRTHGNPQKLDEIVELMKKIVCHLV